MKSSWPGRGWSWDSRLTMVTSSFAGQFEPAARAAISQALPLAYTTASLAKAPAEVRDICERSGGLRSGQTLFAAGPYGDLYAFGLWWPWSDQETISMRVGLVDIDMAHEANQRIRDIFRVTL
jgi:hypothetical protein